MVVAFIGYANITMTTPVWLLVILHLILMMGLALLFTPLFTMGLGVVPHRLYSHGSSLLGTVQQVAGAFGTALVVMVMTAHAATLTGQGVSPQLANLGGMRVSFAISAGVALVVLILVWRLPNKAESPEPN